MLNRIKSWFANLLASIKARLGIKPTAPVATPIPAAPPVAPQTVTLPNTNQEVSTVTDKWLQSGAGYGRVDAPVPTGGSRNTSPNWSTFDGHASRQTFGPGSSTTFSVNVGKPFVFSLSECPGTDGTGTMTITASDGSTITKHFGQAVDLRVNSGNVTIVAQYDRRSTFDATVSPA